MLLISFTIFSLCYGVRAHPTESCDLFTFPSYFKFGAATSAYQVEGGWNEDGKGRTFADVYTNSFPLFNNNATGNIAADSYHQYKEDVAAMKKIGLNYYRFSLSWARILPSGFATKINQAGVDYYNNLLRELEAAGIEPVVTLFHFDSPMTLEYLGLFWTNSKMVDLFVDYADLAFSLFGDRVKLWATINEPGAFCQQFPDYFITNAFPDIPLGTFEYLCGHHMILAHAKAYRLYENKYKATQNGRVSLALEIECQLPLTNTTEDAVAAEWSFIMKLGWFAHPLVHGDYHPKMKEVIARNSAKQNFSTSRLPVFSPSEIQMIKGSYDLFMINTYTAEQVTFVPYNNEPSYLNDLQISVTQSDDWPATAMDFFKIFPESTRYVLKYVKETCNNPEIILTENGFADTGTLNDTNRIDFIRDTLYQVRLAMCEDGVNVTGYTYWSLLDNFEFNMGYEAKFGLVHVNFDDLNRTRTLKKSAAYYKYLIETHNINSTIVS